MKISITPLHIEKAIRLAIIRNNGKKPYQNKRYSSHSDFDTHYIGALAEVVFGELIGVEADYSFRQNGDEYDFIVKGLTIDVKARVRRNGRIDLAVYNLDCLKCDIYVLAIVDSDYVEFVGFTSKAYFVLYGQWIIFREMRWCIRSELLGDVKVLVEKIKMTQSLKTGQKV